MIIVTTEYKGKKFHHKYEGEIRIRISNIYLFID